MATARAAPIYLSQSNYPPDDGANLSLLFDRFERWNALRAGLQTLNFGAALWALVMVAKLQ